jgi:hypothetical protein
MLTDEQLDAIKEKNPGVALRTTRYDEIDADIVFKIPSRVEWDRFLAEAMVDAKRLGAIKTLVTLHVVYPEKADFAKLVESQPGIVTAISGEISDSTGASLKGTTRKL